jgi:hypothetical protein
MPATLKKPTPGQKLDVEHQQFVKCTHCEQRFILTWDDDEWNCVKDWLRIAGQAVRKSHPRHADDQLPIARATRVAHYKKPVSSG